MKQEIKIKLEREQEQLKLYSPYLNVIDFNNYPLFNNVFSKEHKDKVTKSKELYLFHNKRIKNISFDIDNIKNYDIAFNGYAKPLCQQDNNIYKIINKQPRYKDISLFQLLKLFYKEHKISKVMFKDSIKRAKNNKPLRNKVLMLVNSYYKTIKSNNNKTSLSALKRQEDNRTRFNINGYSVIIKKRYSDIINNHNNQITLNNGCLYRSERLKTIYSLITKEFNNKLIQDNKLI